MFRSRIERTLLIHLSKSHLRNRCCYSEKLQVRSTYSRPSIPVPKDDGAPYGQLDELEKIARTNRAAIFSLHRALIQEPYYKVFEKDKKNDPLSVVHRKLQQEEEEDVWPVIPQYERPQERIAEQVVPQSWPVSDRLMVARRYVTHNILSTTAGVRLVHHFDNFRAIFCTAHSTKEPEQRSEEILKLLNALLERLERFNVRPNQAIATYGLELAATAQSTGAFRKYLDLVASTPSYHIGGILYNDPLLRAMKLWTQVKGPRWERLRRQRELLTLLAGSTTGNGEQIEGLPRPSLFSVIQKGGEWKNRRFFRLLRHLGGNDAVYNAWTTFEQVRGERPPESYVVATIAELATGKDHERAWEVYHASGVDARSVSFATWFLLFNRPDLLREWHVDMALPVLRKYNRSIELIEQKLGIKWIGGVEGYHIPLDLEQWSALAFDDTYTELEQDSSQLEEDSYQIEEDSRQLEE